MATQRRRIRSPKRKLSRAQRIWLFQTKRDGFALGHHKEVQQILDSPVRLGMIYRPDPAIKKYELTRDGAANLRYIKSS